jgi:peptidoglycan/xylan/chitin deacetylase (PgdA/CDA1 family)
MKKLTVVMYHYVRDLKHSRYPNIKGLDVSLFKEQIDYLKRRYNFVTVEQVIDSIENKTNLQEHSVLLTFDDAYIDHFTQVFPILKKENIQGAFYPPVKAITEHLVLDVNKIHFILASINSDAEMNGLLNEIKLSLEFYKDEYNLKSYDDYVQKLAVANRFDTKEIVFVKRLLQVELDEVLRKKITDNLFSKIVGIEETNFSRELYMSIDQIKCMKDCGMHIGSHGYDHYWLGSLSKEKQEFEIKKSIEFIEQVGGDINNWTICYPYGNYNQDTLSVLRENSCKLGLTTVVDVASLNITGDEIYKIPRLDTNDLPKNALAEPNDWYYKV